MAGLKISEMPAAGDLDGLELVPVVQGGQNKSVPISELNPDNFQLDIYDWTGTADVAENAFVNYFGLAGMTPRPTNTAGTSIDPSTKALVFPPKVKPSQVMVTIRMTGTIGGPSGTAREWRVQMRRLDATTIISSVADFKITGATIINRDVLLTSFTMGEDDPFHIDGILVGILNNSPQPITMTSLSIRVQRAVNPE